MGMTKAFYFIQNKKQTKSDLETQLIQFQEIMRKYLIGDLQLYFSERMGWFPMFSEELVWQAEDLNEGLLKEIERNFKTTALAMSVLNSDSAFLAICKDCVVQKFVCAGKEVIEEFEVDDGYSVDFPDILYCCGFEADALKHIWNPENYYEYSDVLYDMFNEMETFPVFSSDEEAPDGVQVIVCG